MTQSRRSFEPIKPINRANKNFVYKGKKYPINFCLLKQYSNYFYNQRKHFKNVEDIEIQTNNFEIDEESIPMFVSCCQNQSFDITDSTVFSLYHLSKQYEVPELTKLSDDYIKQNYKNLVLQSIFYIIKSRSSEVKIDLSKEESLISSHFFEYIENDQLISLPIQVLYRILNNNNMNYDSLNPENQKKIVDFLFACLDKHKRCASVLFTNFDFGSARTDVISRLIYDYSDVFDFGMINSNVFLKTTSQLISEIEKLKIEHSNKLSQMEEKVLEQAEIAKKCELQLEEAKKEAMESISLSCRTVDEHIQKFESVLSSQKVEHKRETDELNQRISEMEKKIDEQSRIIENLVNKHVTEIKINSESNQLVIGNKTKLTASVTTSHILNEGVKWKVVQGEDAVEVCEDNEKELVLRPISLGKKIKVVATSGEGISLEKELSVIGSMSGKINVSVQGDQTIKGTIDLVEHGATLDKSRSRYLLSSNGSGNLGADGYSSGLPIESLSQSVSFMKSKGVYYLHALVVDNNGNSFELVSGKLATDGVKPFAFKYSGSVQTVELESGDYRLEVWGAQGGTAYYSGSYDNREGGKGGYSAGTISLRSRTKLFVYVGGQVAAQDAKRVEGGFNGGGYSADPQGNYKKGVGGGGTDIRVREDSLYTRVIVAGGGGGGNGSSWPSCGGFGGGDEGGVGSKHDYETANASAGTQTCGGKPGKTPPSDSSNALTPSGESVATGSFGLGGSVTSETKNTRAGSGGGGWYGGGAGNFHGGSGGGGSGWIFTSSSFSRWKSGNPSDAGRFLLGSEHYLADAVTVSGGNEFASAEGNGKERGHSGHGYARITVL